ncbi:hypothetical protein F8568_043890 [Actinomadura sp. LD22]|uniref:Uncharacterized protein n=1 Tax=Actinomadura physcomitrii TaxID=2650748 RepID=A0A6I4MXQ2_9ACTN|nr:hypothetical protein [Actinomadura physcomitrii]MWA07166.1 hypothetical protein [Actinomadura physcomitrii]
MADEPPSPHEATDVLGSPDEVEWKGRLTLVPGAVLVLDAVLQGSEQIGPEAHPYDERIRVSVGMPLRQSSGRRAAERDQGRKRRDQGDGGCGEDEKKNEEEADGAVPMRQPFSTSVSGGTTAHATPTTALGSAEAGVLEDGDGDLIRDIRHRSTALSAERNTKLDELAAHERERPVRSCPELLDLIPVGEVDLASAPEPVLRRLFEAFRLEISYDRRSGIADCKVTLTGAAIDQQGGIATDVMAEARGGGAAPGFPSAWRLRGDPTHRGNPRRAR